MAWGNQDFIEHYYNGNGAAKTLSDIGLTSEVQATASAKAIDRPGGFKDQVRDQARQMKNGSMQVTFRNSYAFGDIVFAMGDGVLDGVFVGECETIGGVVHVSGMIKVTYLDTFEDPADIIEVLYGSSSSSDAPAWLQALAGLGGTPYGLSGSWDEWFQEVL